jgi:hypothetical protein
MGRNLQRITASPLVADVDEIVAHGVNIHLERMAGGQVWFALYREGSESSLHFWLTAQRRGGLHVSAYWDGDPWPDIRHEVTDQFGVDDG